MNRIASSLPEYDTVMSMFGVGKVYGPQLIAEVGDTRRFRNRRAITAFAGLVFITILLSKKEIREE